MNVSRRIMSIVLCLPLVFAASGTLAAGALMPQDIVAAPGGNTLYVAQQRAGRIAVFDIAQKKATQTIDLKMPVGGMALSKDGQTLYAAGASPQGRIFVIRTSDGKVTATLPAGHTPTALALSPDEQRLYVCNRFNNSVSIIDLATQKEVMSVPVAREPVACVLTGDGKYLFVANLLATGRADKDYVSAVVSVIDTQTGEALEPIVLPNGSTSLRGICVAPDGKHIYVTHILGRYHLPTTQLERGWVNTNALTIIDPVTRKIVTTVLLDDVDQGAANPWGVTCTADGRYICVAVAGVHEIHVIDREALGTKLAGLKQDEIENVPNHLSFMVGFKRRIRLKGVGPRGLVVVGTTVYTAEAFTDSIGMVDINPDVYPQAESIPLGPATEETVAHKGERLFHDADMCFQKWHSCSSCHPDARADGLNWDLLNDGMGNPKQTKNMLLAHRTPPAMITGIRDGAEVAVRAGIRYIEFAVRPEEDAQAIDEYLKSLEPVPSPHLEKGRLSSIAERGAKVFRKAGCSDCHSGEYLTDNQLHKLGLGNDRDSDKDFNTPTLIEAWRTAPYMYNGRCATMRDVLTTDNKGDVHGETSGLSEKDVDALEAFVLSQ